MKRPVEDPGFTTVEGYVTSGEGEDGFGVKGAGEIVRVFIPK